MSVLLFCLCTAPAAAHGVKTKTIAIVHPWTFGAAAAGDDIDVCVKIENIGRVPDRLIGVRTKLARSATIVEPAPGSAAGVRPIAAIEIGPGSFADLRPSGRRLRLEGVAKAQSAWQMFPLTLVFERAGPIVVEVLVEEK